MKTYILEFISKDGNGWAVINAHSPNQAEAVFYAQTKFESTKVANIKESRYYGEEMQLVYEGSIITKTTNDLYTLAIQNGYTGTLEEFIASQKGEKGDDGAHVTSLVKTSTSGLVDTYTITFDDGTSQTFTVTNGEQGKSAYQSYYDTTSDNPKKTEVEWLASLKGDTGMDGVSLGEVAIADNLVTDDSTKVLSAKQGYVLNNAVTQLQTYELGNASYDEDDLVMGYMYTVDKEVGETIAGTMHTGSEVGCMKLDVIKGDSVVIASKGNSSGRIYCLTDKNLVIQAVASSSDSSTGTLTAPVTVPVVKDGYIFIHCKTDQTSYTDAFSVTHYYSEERRLISQLEEDVESLSPEKKVDGIDIETQNLVKASTATRYIQLPYKPIRGKKYTLTITSPSAITGNVDIYACIGTVYTDRQVIATVKNFAEGIAKSIEVEFPDNNRTHIFAEDFENLAITGTISHLKVQIDESNIISGSVLDQKVSSVLTKTVSGPVTLRSADSTFAKLPFKVYPNKTYTLTFKLGINVTGAPVAIYSNTYYGSSNQSLFGYITENVEAGNDIVVKGTFPSDETICLRCTSLFPYSGLTGTISTGALNIVGDDLSENLLIDIGAGSGIFDLNKGSKNILNDVVLKKANSNNLNVFTIAHISDTHGNDANVERFNEWCEKYKDVIDQRVNTGDVMETAYNLGSFDDSLFTKTLITIGNHDTANYDGSLHMMTHQGIDAFEKYIEPLYEGWGVTLAANATEEGYCYYYKDYPEKNIRLIVLDAMDGQSAGQVDWLESRLTEAKTAGYSVIIAYHYIPSKNVIYFDCPFTSEFPVEGDADHAAMVAKVADFQADGGKFLAWMVGHVHRDYCGYIQTTSGSTTVKQVVLCVSTGSNGASNQDMARVEGEKSQDLFNVYGFDTTNKLIKVMRVGADYDLWGRHKNTMCINYETAELLDDKQDRLVSGTNIKTINNQSLLGSGNITIQGGGGSAVQSDWNQSDPTADDYIKNKPTIPAAQVQSNWNESDNTSKAYIQNKPTVYEKPSGGIPSTDLASAVQTSLGKADTALQSTFCPIIEDTRSSAVATITGVAPFSTLVDGQRIIVHLNDATAATTTINLTLSDNTTTGAKPLYSSRNGQVLQVGSNYGLAGAYIYAIYSFTNNRWNALPLQDANTTYAALPQSRIDEGTATGAYTISAKIFHDNVYIVEESYSSGSLKANKMYDFGEVTTALVLPDLDVTNDLVSNAMNFWALHFKVGELTPAGTTELSITFPQNPSGIIVDDEPTIKEGDYVEIMITKHTVGNDTNYYASIKVWQAQ